MTPRASVSNSRRRSRGKSRSVPIPHRSGTNRRNSSLPQGLGFTFVAFEYYYRLSKRDQREYERSDCYDAIELSMPLRIHRMVDPLRTALADEDHAGVQQASSDLVHAITEDLNVNPALVIVKSTRPVNDAEELHGLYEPADGDCYAEITVWMRTAKRNQVVAFRTFLRTLVHELCHHLDYELLELEESFHTEGFFLRESSLVQQIT